MFEFLKDLVSPQDAAGAPTEASAGLLQVTPDATRCVQCGICGFNCPVGIDVRSFAWRGLQVTDSRCIACNACIEKCPRGTLRWAEGLPVREDGSLELDPDALPVMLSLQPYPDGR